MNPSFAYVYEAVLSDRKWEHSISRFETDLALRGLEGRVAKLAMFRSAREMVNDLARTGTKNLVLVGSDRLLLEMAWFLPETGLTIGYVPFGEPTHLATLLGLPIGSLAIEFLARRHVEQIDIALVNERPFLMEAVIPMTMAALEIDGKFKVSPSKGGALSIRNLGGMAGETAFPADATDGQLEAVIQTGERPSGLRRLWAKDALTETRIFFKNGAIHSQEQLELFIDGQPMRSTQFLFSVAPRKLSLICGRIAKPSCQPSAHLVASSGS